MMDSGFRQNEGNCRLGAADVCLGEVLAFVEEGFSGYLGEGVG